MYLELTQKDSLRVEFFRFEGIFDIVSSDLCLILSNLRLEKCKVPPSPPKRNLPNVQNEGGEVKGVLNNVKKTAELVKRYIPDRL